MLISCGLPSNAASSRSFVRPQRSSSAWAKDRRVRRSVRGRLQRHEGPRARFSVDGVGTKLKIAFATDKHDTVGQDLVNHCIDDIAVLGPAVVFSSITSRRPLSIRPDSRASSRDLLRPRKAGGLRAHRRWETAQMPGMLVTGKANTTSPASIAGGGGSPPGRCSDGSKVRPGDVDYRTHASNGPHTNGYFARAQGAPLGMMGLKVLVQASGIAPDAGRGTPARAQATISRLTASLPSHCMLNAAAHIIGGGLVDNLPLRACCPAGARARTSAAVHGRCR